MTAPYDPNWADRPPGADQPPPQGWPQAPQGPPPPAQGWQQPQQNWQQPQQDWQQQPGWAPQQQSYPDPSGWQQQPAPEPLVPPQRHKGHGKAIALAAAALVLVGGGVATYAAVSSSESAAGGSKSPKAAVSKIFTDLQNSDVIGAMDDLPPGERAAVSTPVKEEIAQLKRNDVIRADANLNKVSGITFATSGLTYADGTAVINDHVQVVKLVGGKITVSGDASKLPFTEDFLRAVGADKSALAGSGTRTVDIADVVKRNNRPVRLATQKVDGKWYPSLFYTIADNAATQSGQQAPSAADAIPAVGASSADEAVRTVIQSLISGDARRAIEVLSPDELQVVHDYGSIILANAHLNGAKVQLKDIKFTDRSISGGTSVSLKSLQLTGPNGENASLAVDGSCVKVAAAGQSRTLCGSQLVQQIAGTRILTQAQRTAITDLFGGLSKIGVVATQHDGKWYVNPVRSFAEVGSTLLAGLQPGDMQALLSLANR